MWVGIDPGISGAIAIITRKGESTVLDIPVIKIRNRARYDVEALRSIIEAFVAMRDCHVYIEKAQVMPKQGVVSSSNFMYGYGILIGLLSATRIPYTEVRPQAWKKEIMAGMTKDKGQSIVRAGQLFPHITLNRKKDHGRADALLIALYGKSWRRNTQRVAQKGGI